MTSFDRVEFPHRELTERIIAAFFGVYNELGFGFLEGVYHRALVIALRETGLEAEPEATLPVTFRGRPVGDFSADVLVERKVIVELKAAEDLCPAHEAQLLNYLKASPVEVGLLLNFGPKPRIKRLAFANDRKRPRPPVIVEEERR